jgi:hypothetical protein
MYIRCNRWMMNPITYSTSITGWGADARGEPVGPAEQHPQRVALDMEKV